MLITGLAQTPDIEVVGNERLGDAARQVGAATLDGVERSKLAEIARRAGARFILNGTIAQAGPDLRIDARIVRSPPASRRGRTNGTPTQDGISGRPFAWTLSSHCCTSTSPRWIATRR